MQSLQWAWGLGWDAVESQTLILWDWILDKEITI
jgi:hypothetical protein